MLHFETDAYPSFHINSYILFGDYINYLSNNIQQFNQGRASMIQSIQSIISY